MGKKGTPHRKYSKEEKMRYVRLHLEDHISVRQIERDYGIGNALVSSWVKRYLQDGEDALEPHNGNPYAALHRSKLLSEVERLREGTLECKGTTADCGVGYDNTQEQWKAMGMDTIVRYIQQRDHCPQCFSNRRR
mgnify:FL=1